MTAEWEDVKALATLVGCDAFFRGADPTTQNEMSFRRDMARINVKFGP